MSGFGRPTPPRQVRGVGWRPEEQLTAFLARVCEQFEFGALVGPARKQRINSANWTWRITTESGPKFVKEFRYTPDHSGWQERLQAGADFESFVWRSGTVLMPRPQHDSAGRTFWLTQGSRGRPALVRVHDWVDGQVVSSNADSGVICASGRQLAEVQVLGQRYHTEPRGSLMWPRWDPLGAIDEMRRQGTIGTAQAIRSVAVVKAVIELVRSAERAAGIWTFSHYDHKPNNILLIDGLPALLDWDEAAACPPRYEVAEAALLWSQSGDRQRTSVDRTRLDAFLDGYRSAGGRFDRPTEADFAKWVSAKIGYYDYLFRRSCGEFGDDRAQAARATASALATLKEVEDGVHSLDRWISWMS